MRTLALLLLPATAAAAADARLVDAARRQDAAGVSTLIQEGVDPNQRQADGATALHWAAYWNDVDTAELLLRAGAAPDAQNDLGVTPLSLACVNGAPRIVGALLRAGANPDAGPPSRPPPLMLCARAGSAAAVRHLIAGGAAVNRSEPRRGQTALMWAVAQRHVDVVRELLAGGADVFARTKVRPRFVNIADPNDIYTIVSGTINSGATTPLLFAARHGDLESARLLLAAGADIGDTAADGTSVLVTAVHSGHARLARFLLDAGADPNDGRVGYTALHAAVLRGNRGLVEVLAGAGAVLDARIVRGTPVTRGGPDFVLPHNLVGATPLLLAAKFLEIDILRVLLAHGADPRATLADGTTALMLAAGLHSQPGLFDRRGRIAVHRPHTSQPAREAVGLLAARGIAAAAVNQQGDTALHAAAIHGYADIARFLVEQGALADAANGSQQTPADVAVDPDMVALLNALAVRSGGP